LRNRGKGAWELSRRLRQEVGWTWLMGWSELGKADEKN